MVVCLSARKQVHDMTCLEIFNIIVAAVIGVGQIHIAKRVKDFEIRQDTRDEKRRTEQIYAESTRFIQKYSKDNYDFELYLLPLCVTAYKYNPVYPYRREMYREFCTLTEEVQNEILKRCDINIKSERSDNYYLDMLARIIHTTEAYYNEDARGRFFYDNGKYLERALLQYGNDLVPNNLRCEIDEDEQISQQSPLGTLLKNDDGKMDFDEHLTNLFAYHKNEQPLTSLLGVFQQSNEIVASYICCRIAIVTAQYNYTISDEIKTGYACDYNGQKYMEDLFLYALHTVEYQNIAKENDNYANHRNKSKGV